MPEPEFKPTRTELAALIDYAHRRSLEKYDDGRMWFLVLDKDLPLKSFAWCCLHDPTQAKKYLLSGAVQFHPTLQSITGKDFHCIYFEDSYHLKPYY